MNIYINWILVISACAGLVGCWAYTLELIRGKVNRYTTWKELDSYQWFIAAIMLGGAGVFLATLIIGALIKGHA